VLNKPGAARRLFLGGSVGFAEAYLDGEWDSPDLTALLHLAAINEARLGAEAQGMTLVNMLHRLFHRYNANTKRGSRRNIAFHYDLGNAFYRPWLDRSMTYSSALYLRPEMSLEEAQAAKIERIGTLLEMKSGDRVLEIGCGWGALAEHLIKNNGVSVTGLTLSQQQLAYARDRLGPTVDLRLQDYRDVEGSFDRIVSIEMIEAVGQAHWPRYFKTLRDRLKPGGKAVIQAITIADERFDSYSRNVDFIQRYIFPGGMLPSPTVMRAEAAAAGLVVEHCETFGESYARTLSEWRSRFIDAWPDLEGLGFPPRFRRMWEYYLCYCEAGFRAKAVDVGLWRFSRP